MSRRTWSILLALTGAALCVACGRGHGSPTAPANMPNPASVYCEQQGNQLKIVTAADGSQSGICIFPNGNTCDEWAYFRGECGSQKPTGTPAAPAATPTAQANAPLEDQGGWTYTHPVYGFSIKLPED